MTSCDDPYIGEESIIRPPAATKLRITSAHALRATGSLPTLNVIQLPRPTTGTGSPDEGIGRVRTARGSPAIAGRNAAYAPAAASTRSARRRAGTTGRGGGIPVILRRGRTRKHVPTIGTPCARQLSD